jgi:hypothetical protein
MYGETLPVWFWGVYYLLLLTILLAAVWSVIKTKHKGMAVIAILFSITTPAVGMLNSIGRAEGMNELEHLISQLQHGAVWALFTVIGYIYLSGWFFFFLFNSKKSQQVHSSD